MEDIRWHQRLSHFSKALIQLEEGVTLSASRKLSSLEEQGLIQAFEFTHELAWNVLKDYFTYQGNPTITGSRDASREAFRRGLIKDGEGWMEMIKSRNQSSHTYNEEIASEITDKIKSTYFSLFKDLENKLMAIKSQESD
ncbi:nucleotidyltransferase substrate binding protein (TIGR01987 family) [Algoriphagus boseongensis]|uniref:Nucleotidyltransferase substrate binding protein (TIGR01987 family) n=2 Tax=Algoriphagus boseongensis TaxID=1442587 RepID=A0A4R6T8Z5_9BACT|nr:nucleotidyltransferase substrate binding protein (TIGR01987 family) [Algoriphagus boseongensis]